jgi:hypothetical protein
MATLPPWLDVQPSQFIAAASSGAQAGFEQQKLAQAQQQMQMEAAQNNIKNQLEAQRLQEESKQKQMELMKASAASKIDQYYKQMQLQNEQDKMMLDSVKAAQQYDYEQQKESRLGGYETSRADEATRHNQMMEELSLNKLESKGTPADYAEKIVRDQAGAEIGRVKVPANQFAAESALSQWEADKEEFIRKNKGFPIIGKGKEAAEKEYEASHPKPSGIAAESGAANSPATGMSVEDMQKPTGLTSTWENLKKQGMVQGDVPEGTKTMDKDLVVRLKNAGKDRDEILKWATEHGYSTSNL